MLRRFAFAVLVVSMLISFAAMYVWAHCHTGCEDVENDLAGPLRWVAPQDNEVNYYINETWENPTPELGPDVDWAATQWNRIEYQQWIVNFGLVKGGSTIRYAGEDTDDSINTISWSDELPWSADEGWVPAETYVWDYAFDTDRISEVDTAFNYYTPYTTHEQNDPNKYRIRNIATHEFGHWLFLEDLDKTDGCTTQYKRYTMWHETAAGEDKKETVECEEHHAAYFMYNQKNWDQN